MPHPLTLLRHHVTGAIARGTAEPVRNITPRNITMLRVREFIRQPYAWPGGYPLILVMHDGETLCATCARANYRQISNATRHHLFDGWRVDCIDTHLEGEALGCAHCDHQTPSAYGPED